MIFATEICSLDLISKKEKKELLDFYNENLPKSPWSRKYLESFFNSKNNELICLVIKEDANLVGLILGSGEEKNLNKIVLRALMVRKEFRRMGYATEMIKIFLSKAFEKYNAKTVTLSFRESKKLEEFYSKLGFSKILFNGEYNDGEEKVCMEIENNNITLEK